MLLPKIPILRAIKDTVAVIAQSSDATKCASVKIPTADALLCSLIILDFLPDCIIHTLPDRPFYLMPCSAHSVSSDRLQSVNQLATVYNTELLSRSLQNCCRLFVLLVSGDVQVPSMAIATILRQEHGAQMHGVDLI